MKPTVSAITAGSMESCGGLNGCRKLRDRNAVRNCLFDMVEGRVVVARERRIAALRHVDQRTIVALAEFLLVGNARGEHPVQIGFIHSRVLAPIIGAQLILVAKLALARSMIHQRRKPHVRSLE